MDFLGCLRQQAELRGRMLINASGHDKIFVRANGFQINQLHTIVDGVTQQIELPLAVKFVDKQISQVTFFSFNNRGQSNIIYTKKGRATTKENRHPPINATLTP